MSAPLPVTIALRPGQALDCYLEHLADANSISTARLLMLLRDTGEGTTRFLLVQPSTASRAALAAVTRLAPEEIRRATLAAYDGTALDLTGFDPGDRHSYRTVAARGWMPGRGSRLCPPCLAATGTWQLAWRLPIVTVCAEHRVYLAASCPACERPFRDQHHSPLRRVGAAPQCGNPRGEGPTSQCRHDLTTIVAAPADEACVRRQCRSDQALAGRAVSVLGEPVDGPHYLADLRHLTTLLLHLGAQPAAHPLAAWVTDLEPEGRARTGRRGPRWGLRPPTDCALLSRALTTADDILGRPDLDACAAALTQWLEVTPATPDGPLGWVADRTVMTPTLTRLVLSARAAHRRLSHHLDAMSAPLLAPLSATCAGRRRERALNGVPQVLPVRLFTAHLTGLFDCDPATVRLFAVLTLARSHPTVTSWDAAAEELGLPADLGRRTARAASAGLRGPVPEYLEHVSAAAADLPPADYRRLETKIRRRSATPRWFDDWVRHHRPGTRRRSLPYAITWQWVHIAHGHLSTSPTWAAPPTASQRAAYRQFEASLNLQQEEQLRHALHRPA